MAYHAFKDEDGGEYGSFEVFYKESHFLEPNDPRSDAGWYWWACFPGCLPDGDPNGPFATEAEAIADANDNL